MRIGIIGFRNHASKLAAEIFNFEYVEKFIFYHPNCDAVFDERLLGLTKKEIKISNNFLDLKECNAVIIASPSPTHVDYIKKLLCFDVFIFCEKPLATTLDEINFVRNLPIEKSSRIYVNFHMQLSDFAYHLKKYVASGSIGKPLHINMVSTHGLSFKSSYEDNWRFKSENPFSNIFGNLGIHYLHLYEFLFGRVYDLQISFSCSNVKFEAPDSVNITLRNSNGISGAFFLSYASPFSKFGMCYFNDGIILDKNGLASIQEPRDTFDSLGRFTTPSQVNLPLRDVSTPTSSLSRGINFFLEHVVDNKGFSVNDFELAIRASELVLSNSGKF